MATIDWADQTVLARAAATIRWASVDQDGGPADPGGAVTVDITNSAGTAVRPGCPPPAAPQPSSTRRR